MSDILERMKKRKLYAPVLEVPFPTKESPVMTLKIARFSQVEREGIIQNTAGKLKRLELSLDKDVAGLYFSIYNSQMREALRRHTKGWSCGVKFSPDEKDIFFETLTEEELRQLVENYWAAAKEDEEKASAQIPLD